MGWVTERHECIVDIEFVEALRKAMQDDVCEANKILGLPRNKLESDNRGGALFIVKGAPIARGTNADQYTFKVSLEKNKISIMRCGPDTLPPLAPLSISKEWDAETASCRLYLGSKEVSIRQVSQIALGPMFFEGG